MFDNYNLTVGALLRHGFGFANNCRQLAFQMQLYNEYNGLNIYITILYVCKYLMLDFISHKNLTIKYFKKIFYQRSDFFRKLY